MFALLFLALGCVAAQQNDILAMRNVSEPITTSPSGVFRGSWMTTRRGKQFEAYRGIRYAEPPVGDLRFEPPKPILKYETIVDATEDGPACPQLASFKYPMSEDCLTVNVYTPSNKSSNLLPVIVYIHGGALYSMSGRSEQAGPNYLLDQDIVLVTMNYRLGTLGFLALGTKLAPGNNGYKDQVMALRWVKRNIAAFGGNPDLVTLTGCSAGGASVMLHMLSPMSKGLFHRAISMSGSPIGKGPSPKHLKHLANKQARLVQCPENDARLYDCLKSKPWEELAGSLLGFFEFGYDPIRLWTAVVEPDFGQERFLSVEPLDAIRSENIQSVPFITGLTRDEFYWKAFTIMRNATLFNEMKENMSRIAPISFILPATNSSNLANVLKTFSMAYFRYKDLMNDTFTTEGLGKLYADSITGFPVHRMAVLMCLHSSQPVYYYLFDYMGNHSHYEDPITKKPVGVAHHDDLMYILSLNRFPVIEVSDSEDSKMVDKMTTMWYNFAKTGKPSFTSMDPSLNQSAFSWPVMIMDNRTYLRIDKQVGLGQRLFENRFEVWEDIYRIEYRFVPLPDSSVSAGAWTKVSVSAILLNMFLFKASLKFTRYIGI